MRETERAPDRHSSALVRASLALTATGIVSAATVRNAADDAGDDLAFAIAYALFLGLLLLATPRRPVRGALLIAFAAAAGIYLASAVAGGGSVVGMGIFVVAAALGALATPRRFRPLAVAAFALWTPALRLFGHDPSAGAFPPALAVGSLIALVSLAAVLLDRRATSDDERLRRIGLGLLGLTCVAAVVERHQVVASSGIAPDDLMALVIVVLFPLLTFARLRSAIRDALATGLALATYTLVGLALVLGKGYHSDAVTAPHRAAQLLLEGADPYRAFDLVQALQHFGLDSQLVTHLEDGQALHSLSYPALSFLSVTPFVAAGLADIRLVYLGEIVLMVLLLLRQVRVTWRPLVMAAVVGNGVLRRQNVLAGIDPLWALLVSVGWVFINDRWLSAAAIGLAAADRQPAWFVVPFYVLAVWRRDGRPEALSRVAIIGAAFLAPNLPFIADGPLEFIAGIAGPMFGPLAASGVGLVSFGLDQGHSALPRAVYGLLTAGAFLGLLALLWARWRKMPNAAVVYPFVPLYLGWRSLQNYFAFVPIFAMIGDDDLVSGEDPRDRDSTSASDRSPSTSPAPSASRPAPRLRAP